MTGTRVHVARAIGAPAERVWALLTDTSSYRDWNRSIVSIDGTVAQGSTISLVSTVDPKRVFRLTVSKLARPTLMVWSSGMPLGLFRGIRTYRLAEADGSTEFSMTEEFSGPLAGLIARSIPDMTESFGLFADGLKAAAESTG
jgi:hypothetical protein